MILDELILRNVGVFAGEQSIQLTPAPDKPVILLGGLNGVGKTTILDALRFVLYGKFADCTRRERGGYSNFLRKTITRSAAIPEASIELAFRLNDAHDAQLYRLTRNWHANGKGIDEHFEVTIGGHYDPFLSETWIDYVESLIPRGIADLFFFDGERIEKFADLENSRHLLRAAIHSLLGIEIIDDLSKDLSILRRRKLKGTADHDTRTQIESLSAAIEKLEGELGSVDQYLAKRRNDLESCQKDLYELEAAYLAEGGELADNRSKLESQLEELRRQTSNIETELRELAVGCAPLALVIPSLQGIQEQDLWEKSAAAARASISTLQSRDTAIISLLKDLEATNKSLAAVEKYLENDREQRLKEAECDEFLQLDQATSRSLTSLIDERLPLLLKKTHALLQEHSHFRKDIHYIERQIASIPAGERLQEIRDKRSGLRAEVERIHREIDEQESRKNSLQVELGKSRGRLDQVLLDTAALLKKSEIDHRVAVYSEKTRTTLDRFRSELVKKHVCKIADRILHSYRTLLRKTTLIDSLQIHPDDYSLALLQTSHRPIDPSELSAGERQLLAVSLLWGLARASARPLPTVIDTPLGRLDSSHRSHLVDKYFPSASHQVILLSTDQEIDRHYYNRLSAQVAHEYHLSFDDQTQTTQIERGFFWS